MSFIIDKLAIVGYGINSLIKNEIIVFSLMFLALLMGTFAMFKSLLTFAFKKSQFDRKAINVMAFMLSFIGSTGIAFMYNKTPKTFILLFGGGFGYIFVLFIAVFIFKIVYMFAKEFEDKDGMMGRGPVFYLFIVMALLLIGYMFLGYTGKILSENGCKIDGVDDTISCSGNDLKLFVNTYNFLIDILGLLIFFAIIFGIYSAFKFFGKDEKQDGHDEYQSPFSHEDNSDREHAEHVSQLIREFDHSMHKVANTFQNQSNSLNELQRILNHGGSGGAGGGH